MEVGALSPKACRQATDPRAVAKVSPITRGACTARPAVANIVEDDVPEPVSAAEPPVSAKPSVQTFIVANPANGSNRSPPISMP
ncbi:hypothetical protein D3C86_1861590 [compost metagenome]